MRCPWGRGMAFAPWVGGYKSLSAHRGNRPEPQIFACASFGGGGVSKFEGCKRKPMCSPDFYGNAKLPPGGLVVISGAWSCVGLCCFWVTVKNLMNANIRPPPPIPQIPPAVAVWGYFWGYFLNFKNQNILFMRVSGHLLKDTFPTMQTSNEVQRLSKKPRNSMNYGAFFVWRGLAKKLASYFFF